MRATRAMIRADSIRKTASTASLVAVGVTPTDQSSHLSVGQVRKVPWGQPSAIWRNSAVMFQWAEWVCKKRLVHSRASALSLA